MFVSTIQTTSCFVRMQETFYLSSYKLVQKYPMGDGVQMKGKEIARNFRRNVLSTGPGNVLLTKITRIKTSVSKMINGGIKVTD